MWHNEENYRSKCCIKKWWGNSHIANLATCPKASEKKNKSQWKGVYDNKLTHKGWNQNKNKQANKNNKYKWNIWLIHLENKIEKTLRQINQKAEKM